MQIIMKHKIISGTKDNLTEIAILTQTFHFLSDSCQSKFPEKYIFAI